MGIAIPKNIEELKQHLNDPLFKNSYFLMASTVVGSILGFIFWMVVARYYTPHEVGLATALISATVLLAGFSKLGFDVGLIRFLPSEQDKKGMINSCLTITAFVSFLLAFLFVAGLDFWSPALLFIRENMAFILSFIAFTTVSTLLVLQYTTFIAFRSAKFSFIQNTLWMVLRIPLAIAFISFGVFGIFSSWGIAICTALIVSVFFFNPIVQPKYLPIPTIKKKMITGIMHFSFGNYVAGIFGVLPNAILPLLIINILSAEMTAYFYIAWMIAGVLYAIPSAVNMSLFSEGSNEPEKLHSDVIRAMKFMFIFLIPAIVGIFFLGEKLLLVFGREYSENAVEMLWILTISSVPVALNSLYITIKRVQIKVKPIIYIHFFIAIFTIMASYILMTKIGLIGVGIAWILSQGIITMIIGVIALKWYKEQRV